MESREPGVAQAARQLQPYAQGMQCLPQLPLGSGPPPAGAQLMVRQLQPNAQGMQCLPQLPLGSGPPPAGAQLMVRQLQPNAQGMQCLPQLTSACPGTTFVTAPFIKLEDLKAHVQVSAEPHLLPLAASLAGQAVGQCAAQVSHPQMARSTTEALAKALREAVSDVELVASTAVQAVTDDVISGLRLEPACQARDVEAVFRQVIYSTADMNRTELLPTKLQAKLQPNGKPMTGPLLAAIEDCLEAYLLESYQSAVATMSHFFVSRAVEAVVRPILEPVIAALSEHVLRSAQSEALLPAIGDEVRLAAKKVSKQAAADAWNNCRSTAVNVAVACSLPPLGAPAPPPRPPAMALQPQAALPAVRPVHAAAAAQAPSLATPQAPNRSLLTPSSHPPSAITPCPLPSPSGTDCMSDDLSVISMDLVSEPPTFGDELTGTRASTSFSSPAAAQQPQPAEDYHSNASVESLSDELLALVLLYVEPSQLVACARVSRRWRAVSRGVWGRVTLRYEPRFKQRFIYALLEAPELAVLDCALMAAGRSNRAAVPPQVRHALLETSCHVRGLRLPTEDFEHEFVIAVLIKHAPTLEMLDLVITCPLCEYSSVNSPSQLFSVIDSMGNLKRLRLAGPCDVEYSFRARPLGAPARALQVLDLRDYRASSAHTMSSLIRAHQDTLQEALLSPRTHDEELINLSMCPSLHRLTLPVDLLTRCRPASLPAVVSLTLTQSDVFLPEASPAKRRKTFMLPALHDLTLEGVTKHAFIPKPIRAAFDLVRSLKLVRTALASALPDLVQEMPLLERLAVHDDASLSADAVLALPRAAPWLKHLHLTLRCAGRCTGGGGGGACWRPAVRLICTYWPRSHAGIDIDLICGCAQPPGPFTG